MQSPTTDERYELTLRVTPAQYMAMLNEARDRLTGVGTFHDAGLAGQRDVACIEDLHEQLHEQAGTELAAAVEDYIDGIEGLGHARQRLADRTGAPP